MRPLAEEKMTTTTAERSTHGRPPSVKTSSKKAEAVRGNAKRLCDGQELKRLLGAGTAWLEKNADRVNALNVFPVPDGDTGTNMLLTMQAAMAEVADNPSHHAGEIAHGVSQGALMGARGNSGVILSQILRGFAYELQDVDAFGAAEFAAAAADARNTAYKAVSNAVEGTILTVISAVAAEAESSAGETDDLLVMLEHIVQAAGKAVEETPTLLDILAQAGVVDAGGLGLKLILEGALRYMRGETLEVDASSEQVEQAQRAPSSAKEMSYGYCTEFVLQGSDLDFEEVKRDLIAMGDSALVVGDDFLIRVHIHTFRPGQVLDYATQRGTLHKIKIDNMQEQHEHFVGLGLSGAEMSRAEPGRPGMPRVAVEELSGIAVVAVVPGPGLEEVFKSMGVSAVVPGGQTMNPSTKELLEAIASVDSDQVILLPNNKNVLMVAEQAEKFSNRKTRVVPTYTVPQGIAALVALNYHASLDENVAAMIRAIDEIQTGEVTRAVRSVEIGGVHVDEGEVIGLLNGELVSANSDIDDMALKMLSRMQAAEFEIITIFYGQDVSAEQAKLLQQRVQTAYPGQDVEVVSGGQPYYHYILSAE
jgi:DAK2 domain fusion protein YloV